MGIAKRRTTIDDTVFEIQGFGAKQGQHIFRILAQILGTGAGPLLSQGSAGASSALSAALAACTAQAQDEVVNAFTMQCKVIMTTTGGDEVPAPLAKKYDDVFAGRYLVWLEWLAWCIREEYADFFGERFKGLFLALMATAEVQTPLKSDSPPE